MASFFDTNFAQRIWPWLSSLIEVPAVARVNHSIRNVFKERDVWSGNFEVKPNWLRTRVRVWHFILWFRRVRSNARLHLNLRRALNASTVEEQEDLVFLMHELLWTPAKLDLAATGWYMFDRFEPIVFPDTVHDVVSDLPGEHELRVTRNAACWMWTDGAVPQCILRFAIHALEWNQHIDLFLGFGQWPFRGSLLYDEENSSADLGAYGAGGHCILSMADFCDNHADFRLHFTEFGVLTLLNLTRRWTVPLTRNMNTRFRGSATGLHMAFIWHNFNDLCITLLPSY